MIVYDRRTGSILRTLPNDQDINIFFRHYPSEVRDNLAYIETTNYPTDLKYYKVTNSELVRRTEQEIQDIQRYGKVLTNEERLLESMKPSYDEVDKAERTIEILSLIQEVI